ncbi:MAG: Histidine kinase-, DNA gyrase B-, and HSP90-like ATPase [Phormidium sp. OSCR]|nr:MAG: Histidine kinase-, DNA gyrase B-, and HSP90-like ATPase [Phormidium sp. OSCR]
MKPSPLSVPWATFATGLVLGLAVMFLDQAERRRFQSQTRQSVLQQLNTVRSILEGQLNTHLQVAQRWGDQTSPNSPLTEPHRAIDDPQLQQDYPAIRHLVWTPLTIESESRPASPRLQAAEEDSSGQVQLIIPIDLTPQSANPNPLGQLNLPLDLKRLLEESPLGERVSGLDWALRRRVGGSTQLLVGNRAVFNERPVTADVRFSQEVWQIAATPVQGWTRRSPLQPWIRILGTATTLGAMLLLSSILRSRQRYSQLTESVLKQLNQQESQYRCMADRTPVLLLQLDLNGVPRFANLYSQNFLGYDFPTLEETPLAQRLRSPELQDLVQEAQQTQTLALSRTVPIRRRNGEQVWVNWHICLLADQLGGPRGLLCIGYDVSDRQGLQTRLMTAEAQLRRLFSLVGDRLVLVDRQGQYCSNDPKEAQQRHLGVESFSKLRGQPSFSGTCLHDSFSDADADQILMAVKTAITYPQQDCHLCLELTPAERPHPEVDTSHWLSLWVFPFLEGTALLWMQDISEQQHLKFRLEQTQRELEQRVRDRTAQVYDSNKRLQREVVERMQMEEALRRSEERERDKARQLEATLGQLKRTQAQLVQTEKMSSLGQLAAGMAHEINNPVNFIYGNLTPVRDTIEDLLELLHRYQDHYPQPPEAIASWQEEIELPFLQEDIFKILKSMEVGAQRIQTIVASLKNFAHLDEMGMKSVDLHEGIDSTLMVLRNRLMGHGQRPDITISKTYSELPKVTCYASQINQVLMNLFENAIDAIEERLEQQPEPPPEILVSTHCIEDNSIKIILQDNGTGIPEEVQRQIFNPFFTTKVVGKGTGLGLSIAYQVIHENHSGTISIISQPGQTRFEIQLPQNPNYTPR